MNNITLPKDESDTSTGNPMGWENVDVEQFATAKQQWQFSSKSLGLLSKKLKEVADKIDEYKAETDYIQRTTDDIKQTTDKGTNFIMAVAGIIIVGFFLASIPIFLDYLKNNGDRHEEEMTQIQTIKKDYYSKDELKNLINENNRSKEILNCIKIKGYFTIQCFQ